LSGGQLRELVSEGNFIGFSGGGFPKFVPGMLFFIVFYHIIELVPKLIKWVL
jgi:hypothetical protein